MSRPDVISPHEIRTWQALHNVDRWMTVLEVSASANVARRTAALHLSRFVALGVADRALVFPGYRYRPASKPNAEYVAQLDSAAAVLAVKVRT